ncbi:hypothetical protein RRM29_004387 [Salmonella enterica]|nr:hypothetical protein [Salmonella enterica]EDR5596553.1 hypothetical protein [Salmonella enterica subsp. diarizonae]EDU6310748.1 hypothetical protein [Salmonella enterica subsp. diarizonae serovar 53:z10:z]EBK3635139.1 hypothetical protein [Salmonella enterica]EGW0492812.1 hypothetical protein [Salmonella enterica]
MTNNDIIPSAQLTAEERIIAAECGMYEALKLADERLEHINAIYDRERQEYDNCVKEKTRLALELVTARRRIADLEARLAGVDTDVSGG